ncbi:aldo-keto reductase family 1 member B1-like isoform X1 [Ptychodera flava]|uniref:aldo-keto reductase family 1 member B1-like isoform X1 n=1 Tax=Ptychodera flava TaxID=63121 RepID=UPI00396A5492
MAAQNSRACLVLSNGMKMPQIGFGTLMIKPHEAVAAVKAAIDAGYRHIDTAYVYDNEEQIGQAIKEVIAEGKVKREELFIVTKLAPQYLSPERVREGFDNSLKLLQLDYVDLYLMHVPTAVQFDKNDRPLPTNEKGELRIDVDVDYVDTWKEMEKLVDEGLAKSIGVSNFNEKQIERVLQVAKHKPVNNQIEVNPYFTRQELVSFCQSNGIVVTSYSSLGAPGNMKTEEDPVLLSDPVVKAMGAKYNRSPAQILLRYPVSRGCAVIPKSLNPEHMKENMQIQRPSSLPICLKNNVWIIRRCFKLPGMTNYSSPALQ